MDAGREMDALVAEKVMGLLIAHREWPCGRDPECGVYEAAISDDEDQGSWFAERGPIYKRFDPTGMEVEPHELGLWCNPVPFYSTDIAAAWLVVERMRARRLRVAIIAYLDGSYGCELRNSGTAFLARGEAPTAPLAICRAALAAVAS